MMELKEYNHIYFLGIGGIGMSALARWCLLNDIKVSGYDRSSSTVTEALTKEGANIQFDDDPEEITGHPELVIYTPAIPFENRIRAHFVRFNVPMVKRSEALEWTTNGVDTIAVAGTHGKTTTSSMISYLLDRVGIKHTALLGGIAVNYDSNFISRSLDLMVVEADEYDRSFLRLHPRWVVLTAMDPDHLDIYGTYEEMLNGYRQFLLQIESKGTLIYRHDLEDLIGKKVMDELKAQNIKLISFGLEQGDYHAADMKVEKGVWHWALVTPTKELNEMALLMPGRHNVLNATAACAMALEIGGDGEKLKEALPGFKGVSRRFEIRYQDATNVLIDDYAHHPEELIAAITAAKETYGKPVVGVFQPHLYSRTRDLAEGFAAAMDLLDVPVIIDIYPAREKPIPGVSSQTIFDLMKNPNKKRFQGETWLDWIVQKKPDVLITLGAGDLDKHIPELIRKLYKND
ncbi:MAG TPA: UDP-N-acetylmuramate--L-alanine ligase [Saprospiraceae bacterium]|nr:UDP-N-acetylmuramate--L-alanine ligase [Saprospiraceae bacterium]